MPRWLVVVGMAASAWAAACTFAYLVAPGFADVVNVWWFDTPLALYELALGGVLATRGLRRVPEDRGTV